MSHFLVIYELVPEATYYTLMEVTDENIQSTKPQEAAENQKFGLLENPVTIEGVYTTGQIL